MPEALEYRDPAERGPDSYLFQAEHRDRIDLYNRAWDYYRGKQKKHLRVKRGEPDDNIALNLVRMTADRTVSMLYPEIPEIVQVNGEKLSEEKQVWVYRLFKANNGLAFFHKIALLGFLSGHVYVRVMPPRLDDPQNMPRLKILLPGNVQTFWKAGDIDTVVWHEVTWETTNTKHLIDFVNRDTFWEINQYNLDGGRWKKVPEKSAIWDSPYSPIVHWQHYPNPAGFYGLSEAEDLTLQDAANLVLSEALRILRYHASPRTVVQGVEAEDIIETGIDNLWVIENPDAKITNLEMVSQLEASQKIAQMFFDAYLAQLRTVLLRGEVKDFQRVTNTGVNTVFMDSLRKREVLVNQYGNGLAEVLQRAHIVTFGRSIEVAVRHPNPLPLDLFEQARADSLRIRTGIESRQNVVTRDGRSWEELLNQLEQEHNNPVFGMLEETTPNSEIEAAPDGG